MRFWQGQALDKMMAKVPLKVPVMWLQGLWDQEDMWGAIHSYEAVEPKDTTNTMNYLVMGPWRHSQVNYEGYSLGPLRWDGDTAEQFRRDVLLPFFNQYLMDGAPKADTPPVLIYNTGENHWDRFKSWPLSCEKGCADESKPLYLTADMGLSFTAPDADSSKFDEYVSDPAKPVPYIPRPVMAVDGEAWMTWLVHDQRFVDSRPDVLSYETAPLTEPLRLSGAPIANLVASTTGTDSDWVVKLIDVYPPTTPNEPEMGGYELPISLDIFRGRYRTSFEHPEAIAPGKPLTYRFALADGEPRVSAGASGDGADSVDAVSALRSQPADVCAEYLRREAGGLSEGHAENLACSGRGKLRQPSRGGALTQPCVSREATARGSCG